MKHLLPASYLLLVALLASCDSGSRRSAADTAGGGAQSAEPVLEEVAPVPEPTTDSAPITATDSASSPKSAAGFQAKKAPFRSVFPDAFAAEKLRSADEPSTGLAPGATLSEQCAKAPQQFVLRAGVSDTILTCAEGTQIAIPGDAFVDAETQEPVEGPVEFRVQEYLSLADIVLNNLSTTTSSGQLLETSGMLNLQAVANGRKLALRSGAALTLAFPRKGTAKPDMQTFLAPPTATAGQPFDWEQMPVPKWSRQVYHFMQKGPRYAAGNSRLKRELKKQLPFSYAQAKRMARERLPKSERKRVNSRRRLVDNILVHFEVGVDSVVRNVRIVEGYDTELKAAALNAVKATKGWRPALCNGQTTTAGRYIRLEFLRTGSIYFDFDYYQGVGRGLSCLTDTIEEQFSPKSRYFRQQQLTAYVLQTTQLGFINCDRFYTSPQPKIDLMVQAPQAVVQLIFHNFRSVVSHNTTAGKAAFEDIPEGEPVTILALRSSEKQVMLATRRTTTGPQTERDLVFRPVSMDELRAELQKLEQ